MLHATQHTLVRTCDTCGRVPRAPQRHVKFTPTPYKRNGWIGDQFIPYDKRWKGGRETKIVLCGLCYAKQECEAMRDGGKDVTELEQLLLEMAEKETAPGVGSSNGTASDHKRVQTKVPQTKRRRKAKAPKMTPEQAVTFNQHSTANMVLVETVLNCDCMAYADVFTYRRWRAQGFQVQRGQKAIRVPLVKDVSQEDDETGEVTHKHIKTSAAVFCRHQVQEVA